MNIANDTAEQIIRWCKRFRRKEFSRTAIKDYLAAHVDELMNEIVSMLEKKGIRVVP